MTTRPPTPFGSEPGSTLAAHDDPARDGTPQHGATKPARRHALGCLAAGLVTVLATGALAGCAGGLLPKPQRPPTRFTLDDAGPQATPPEPAAGAPALVVVAPRAAPGHDSPRMLYLRRPHELEAFAFHEWVDTPASMLAPLLVRALQASGAFGVVLLAPSAARGALQLETELIRLQQDFGTRPSQVRLTLRAVLLDSATRKAIAWREFDASIPAPSEDPAGGAAASQQAAQRVLAELAAFCALQVRR